MIRLDALSLGIVGFIAKFKYIALTNLVQTFKNNSETIMFNKENFYLLLSNLNKLLNK